MVRVNKVRRLDLNVAYVKDRDAYEYSHHNEL
jgi:hypothetical protein